MRTKATDKRLPRLRSRAAMALIYLTCLGGVARAADLDGAWITNLEACKDVFVKKDNRITLASNADVYGSGFVVDGKIIRGKMATCKITSLKKDGATMHLKAMCATDIMASNNQFDLKMIDDNKIIRGYPGVPELDSPYYRCPSN